MLHYAILIGSAPEDFRQKKIEEMYDFLDSKRNAGDSIVTFANGISELMLEMVMDNSMKQLAESVIEPVEITGQNARHCETKPLRHCERSEAISANNERDYFVADAPCNSELDSESESVRHLELDSGSTKKMLKQVQHDKNARHCERPTCRQTGSEAISENSERDCFVADAPRNDEKTGHSELVSESVNRQTLKQSADDNDCPRVQGDDVSKSNSILLYICTLQPVAESEKTIWLGGEEIRRDVIRHSEVLAAECGIDMQVIFDADSEMVREEKLGWEKVVSTGSTTTEFSDLR